MSGLASSMTSASPARPPVEPGSTIDSTDLDAAGVGAGPAGGPGTGPSSGPSGGPAPAPTPTPGPSGGGGTPAPSPAPDGTGGSSLIDEFADTSGQSLLDMLKTATSPEALEAQNILLRRMALQGDVIPSRVPPPRNITEIGGYLNLLTTLNEIDMRSQVLAGILGVAGPNPPLGWSGAATPLSFTPVVNDRPAGPFQASLPVTILVRSDFAGLLRTALTALHDRGCQLPMVSGPLALPPAGGYVTASLDPLDYIGRTLHLADSAALADPATDPIVLARPAGSTGPYQIALRSDGSGSVSVAAADFDALQRTPSGFTQVALTGATLVTLKPILEPSGFVPAEPLPTPTTALPGTWAKLSNTTGLATGVRLGDELRLLHSATEISGSALGPCQDWRWDGHAFTA